MSIVGWPLRHMPFVLIFAAILSAALFLSSPSHALLQTEDETGSEAEEPDPCDEDYDGDEECEDDEKPVKKNIKVKKLSEFIEGKAHAPGFFDFYTDESTGEVFMAVREDQLEQEFIYFSYTRDGSIVRRLRRLGNIADNSIFSLRRHYQQIDFIQQNTNYTFDDDSPLAKGGANITSPFVATTSIVAQNEDQSIHIIDVSDVFSANALVRIGGDRQGELQKKKSRVTDVINYPSNSKIIAEYVFDFPNPRNAASSSSSVIIQHNFVQMPDEGFVPRQDDSRVGFFTTRRTNLTRIDGLPYDDLILRWRLEKENPDAAISDPIKPITFWIENTTPFEYREVIRSAVLRWNDVFEKAGFSNAIVVNTQPDDAPWDAGDVRYNVLRWVTSPLPGYLGYGPNFHNPRTGEILGADIVLEHASIRRTVRFSDIYGVNADGLEAPVMPGVSDHTTYCSAGHELAFGSALARISATAQTETAGMRDNPADEAITREGLYYLVLHEVGHTLGLTHNMMGSYFQSPDDLNGPEATTSQRLSNSVMDYPAVNIAPKQIEQGRFFPDEPGPYDVWAIGFGYKDEIDDEDYRRAHLARSSEAALLYANDGDLMSQIGLGIDPRVNVFDLSNDPIGYADSQMTVIWNTMSVLKSRMIGPDESWEELNQAFNILLSGMERLGAVTSRYVGGVYVDRSYPENVTDAPMAHTPVPYNEQKRAMEFITSSFFSPSAFEFPDGLLGYLQKQRRGFDFANDWIRQDPLVHAQVRSIQTAIISHFLHHRTLRRMTDTSLYGNEYSVHEMLGDLTAGVFDSDLRGNVSTIRRNLQVQYVKQLIRTFRSGSLDAVSEAALLSQLEVIDNKLKVAEKRGDAETRSHRRYVRRLIKEGLTPPWPQ